MLRGCSRFNEYIELFLNVDILANNPPSFETSLVQNHEMKQGDVLRYQLPKLIDKEGNDVPALYVRNTTGKPYPPFMFFENKTQTLVFRPHSVYYQGYKYYWDVVVYEKNSPEVNAVLPCSIEVVGEVIDPMDYINFTDISFKMTKLDESSNGVLSFSHAVNLTFISENFDDIFDYYLQNVTYHEHKENCPLLDFEITPPVNETGRNLFFRATFDWSYFLGLLVRRKDKFFIHMNHRILDTYGFITDEYAPLRGMFLGNHSETRIFPEVCYKDKAGDDSSPDGFYENRKKLYTQRVIPLQFDMRSKFQLYSDHFVILDHQMVYMKAFAEGAYWYLSVFLVLQFFVLTIQNVGLLPLWSVLDYMQ